MDNDGEVEGSNTRPIKNDDRVASMETGMFDMPKPQGWTIERVISLMAGALVVVTLILGCERSKHWRFLTGFVGVNLIMDALVGWCPSSVVLHHLGVPTAAERAIERDQAS